jgi:hypothetical protein
MSIVKALDVAYVRFRAPDLGVMRSFLIDFGMLDVSGSTENRLFMRGFGSAPFLHETELGEPGFAGFGVCLADVGELKKLAEFDGAPMEAMDTPGGGFRVRLTDPDGHVVDAVAGQTPVEKRPVPPHTPWNQGGSYPRLADFRRAESWYKTRFGYVTSDEIQPAPNVAIGAFMRFDRGEDFADHHALFLMQAPGGPPSFMHAAFEVSDLDDLMAGHDYLKNAGRKAQWGIGRHKLGSQVFDYWLDPWGHELEHWTDGDQLRASDGSRTATMEEVLGVQWGMKMPPIPGVNAPPL